jgi:hypothetical protein
MESIPLEILDERAFARNINAIGVGMGFGCGSFD